MMNRSSAFRYFTLLMFLVPVVTADGQNITLVPGHYSTGWSNGNLPTQLATDSQGNVYVADGSLHIIERYSPGSTTSTILAGQSYNYYGPPGDGGPATAGVLSRPAAVALDQDGNIYIADTGHDAIRKVDAVSGIISLVAAVTAPSSLALDAVGNIYVTSFSTTNIVYKIAAGTSSATAFAGTGIDGYSGDGGPANLATFGISSCVASDPAGYLYIADSSKNVIRKIHLATNIITTVAGTGEMGYTGDGGLASAAKLNTPAQIAFDAAGDLYISDSGNSVIRRVTQADQVIRTIVGGGRGVSAVNGSVAGSALDIRIQGVVGLVVDVSGNLWFCGYGLQKVTPSAEPAVFEGTVIGQQSVTRMYNVTNIFTTPIAVASIQVNGANASEFLQQNDCPGQLPSGGSCSISIVFTPQQGGIRTAAIEITNDSPGSPHLISLTGTGIASSGYEVSLGTVATGSSFAQQVGIALPENSVSGISASLAFGNEFVVSLGSCSARTCTVSVQFKPKYPGLRNDAIQLKDAGGNLIATQFISGVGQAHRLAYRPGSPLKVPVNSSDSTSQPSSNFAGAAIDPGGTIYASDNASSTVFRWNPTTNAWIRIAGAGQVNGNAYSGDGGPAINAYLSLPHGLATDPAGNLYICDTYNHVIRRVDRLSGNISTLVGNGRYENSGDGLPAASASMQSPSTITIDGSGNAFIGDFDAHVVRRWDAQTGKMSTIAGSGTNGYTGDGGQATAAALGPPSGLAIGPDGNLYIADLDHHVVRMVDLSTGVISTIAGTGRGGDSGDGGPAISAQLDTPAGLLFDPAGSLYISTFDAVREISPARDRVSTLTSTDQAVGPLLMAGDGTLFVISTGFNGFTIGPDPLTFSETTVGSSAVPQTVILENSGSASTAKPRISIGGTAASDFNQSNTCTSDLAPGDRCSITFGFLPTALGFRTVSALVGDTPSFSLSGSGSLSLPSGETKKLFFANTNLSRSSVPQSFYIKDIGTIPLSISSASIAGPNAADFALQNQCTQDLNPQSICLLIVTFTPSGTGLRTATLKIALSAPGYSSSVDVELNGYGGTGTALSFIPTPPCRVVDTRNGNGPFGGPEMAAASKRTFTLPAASCGIPLTALAYSLNVTVVPDAALGFLSIWPDGQPQPQVSTLNSDGRVKANAVVVGTGLNGVSVFASDPTQVIIDINGYFVDAATSMGLSFFPLPPCRLADTRNPAGSLGGPNLVGGQARSFPVLSSTCNIPSTAQAYSLNLTAIPHQPIGFLTTWATGKSRPFTSTLNTSTLDVTANAALVPAGTNGEVSVYSSHSADLVIDVNGYFAPSDLGGLSFYPIAPCRSLDTRNTNSFSGVTKTNSLSTACGIPPSAQAFVTNATVVPRSPLGFLSLWPDGLSQPWVSTLNANDQTVTSNMAIVPSTNGFLDVYASSETHLILDVAGYFAP